MGVYKTFNHQAFLLESMQIDIAYQYLFVITVRPDKSILILYHYNMHRICLIFERVDEADVNAFRN